MTLPDIGQQAVKTGPDRNDSSQLALDDGELSKNLRDGNSVIVARHAKCRVDFLILDRRFQHHPVR